MNPLASILHTLRYTGHYHFCHEQSLSLYEHSHNLYYMFTVNNQILIMKKKMVVCPVVKCEQM